MPRLYFRCVDFWPRADHIVLRLGEPMKTHPNFFLLAAMLPVLVWSGIHPFD